MRTQQPAARQVTGAVLCLLMTCSGALSVLHAQDEAPKSSFVKDVVKGVVLDPTTYAPSIIAYDATMRDWNTSQPFFRNGFLERNPRYTMSGLPYDLPLNYQDGSRKIFGDALANFGTSLAHNALERTLERGLLTRYPEHRRLIRTLGWVERISFGVGMSYVLSSEHYRQAQMNAAQAGALGLR